MLTINKQVRGQVTYNDGEFAEIQTVGLEGFEQDILLTTIQAHREDTPDSPGDFLLRFPIGGWVEISSIMRFTRGLEGALSGTASAPPHVM